MKYPPPPPPSIKRRREKKRGREQPFAGLGKSRSLLPGQEKKGKSKQFGQPRWNVILSCASSGRKEKNVSPPYFISQLGGKVGKTEAAWPALTASVSAPEGEKKKERGGGGTRQDDMSPLPDSRPKKKGNLLSLLA